MNIELEQLPECKATLRIEIPADTVSTERDQVTKLIAGQAKLPGFRPGKVPKAVIQKRYEKQISEELTERLVNEGCRTGIKEKAIEVISVNKVENSEFNVDGTFSFTADLTTAPVFELPEYKGIQIKVPKIAVKSEHVDQAIESFRERFADFNDIEDRALEMGDIAVLDYDGTIDGKPVGEVIPKATAYIAKNNDYWIKLTDESFLPGFCAQIVGASIGDERSVTVTLPEDFPISDMVGKEIVYAVTIKGVKEQILPEVNDELAAKVQPGKTLEELRGLVEEQIQSDQERQAEEMKTNQVIDFLTNQLEFELPSDIVKNETQQRVNEMVERGEESGMEQDEIVERQQEIFDSATNQARNNVKTSFILHEIAKKEEIKVEDSELIERVNLIAERNKTPLKKFVTQLKKTNGISRIQEGILISKTLEYVKKQAVVEEVEPDAAAASANA